MIKQNELISYAMDFASYLVSKIENIDRIILHGSVVRGDFDEDYSDIDIFVDSADKKIRKKTDKIILDYYKTKKFKEWELKGVKNQFSVITGKLDEEWKNLKRAIINTGVVLYGKYKSDVEKVNYYTLFSFENIKPDKKRISIFRKLFGFKHKNKLYPGLIDEINGIRVGKGNILIPAEHVNKIKKYFQEKKVPVKLYDFWSDEKY